MATKEKKAKVEARQQKLDRVLADFPSSVEMDGVPQLHQRAVKRIPLTQVYADSKAILLGVIVCLVLLVVLIGFAPIWLTILSALGGGFGVSYLLNKEGDGIHTKKPRLRAKWSRIIPNRVRVGRVGPHSWRLITVIGEGRDSREASWRYLEENAQERIR